MSFSTPLAWYWVLAPLLVALLAVWLLLRALVHLFHGRLAHGGLHATGSVALGTMAALCAGLIVLNTLFYSRLTSERPAVAEVTVAAFPVQPDLYRVTVQRLDHPSPAIVCSLQGDEWLLSSVRSAEMESLGQCAGAGFDL